MRRLRKFILLCSLFGSYTAYSQTPIIPDTTIIPKEILEKEKSIYLFAHSRGLGIGAEIGKRINVKRSTLYMLEISNIRSLNQARIYNPFFNGAKSYFLGKLNYVYAMRVGRKYNHLISPKPYWNGVRVSYSYAFGVDLFFLKPYYIEVIKVDNEGVLQTEKERYNPEFHHEANIFGRAPFLYELGKSNLQVGAFGQLSLNIEFGKDRNKIRALEVGATCDIAPMGIDFTARQKQVYIIPSFFLRISFGKRYNDYGNEKIEPSLELKNVE